MRITVKLFASLRERAGVATLLRSVPEGTTAGALLAALEEDLPPLRGAGRIAFAFNSEYTRWEHPLRVGGERALSPPVSSGCLPRTHREESTRMFRLIAAPIVIDELLAAVADPTAGAVVLFIGTTRDHNDGR